MATWGSCDFSNLTKMLEDMEGMEKQKLNTFYKDCSKELAQRLLALVIKRTPVGKAPEGIYTTVQGEKHPVQVVSKDGKRKTFRTVSRKYKLLTKLGTQIGEYWYGYKGGTLRRGWRSKIRKAGNDYEIIVENPVQYASYVEEGHRQTPGRFVPAIGKRLKSGFVPGQHMMMISLYELEQIAPALLEKKLEIFLKEALESGES